MINTSPQHKQGSMIAALLFLYMFGPVAPFAAAQPEPRAALKNHKHTITCLAFSPDGKLLASGSKDTTVILWDWPARKPIATLEGHVDMVLAVAFSRDGKTLATTSHDKVITLWDNQGKQLGKLSGHDNRVHGIVFGPDDTLYSVSDDTTLKIWDLKTGKVRRTLSAGKAEVNCVALSKDGKLLASGGWDKTVHLRDLAADRSTPLQDHTDMVRDLVFTPDGQKLISSGKDGIIRVWDVPGRKLHARLEGNKGLVRSLALTPDGKMLASASKDGCLKLWDVPGGKLLSSLEKADFAFQVVAFAPDGQTLATGGINRQVLLWNLGDLLKAKSL